MKFQVVLNSTLLQLMCWVPEGPRAAPVLSLVPWSLNGNEVDLDVCFVSLDLTELYCKRGRARKAT